MSIFRPGVCDGFMYLNGCTMVRIVVAMFEF